MGIDQKKKEGEVKGEVIESMERVFSLSNTNISFHQFTLIRERFCQFRENKKEDDEII